MCTEITKVRKQDCRLYALTSWGRGSIFAIFTSWVHAFLSVRVHVHIASVHYTIVRESPFRY